MPEVKIENQTEIQDEIPQIKSISNSFFVRLSNSKKKLSKEIKKTITSRYNCHWNDDKKTFSIPLKNKILVENYLNNNGIKFSLEEGYDEFFNLSPSQQKQERLSSVKNIKTLKGLERISYFKKLLDDFNALWNTSLKAKDFEEKSLEELSENLETDKQKEQVEILFQQYQEINHSKVEVKELDEKINSLNNQPTEDAQESNPDDWPFVVLGLNYSMEILLSYKGRILKWPVERLSEMRIKAIFGPSCDKWQKMRDAIIYEAHDNGFINDETPIKQGVWKLNNKWIVVSGKHAGIFEGSSFKELNYPVFEGKLIAFEDVNWLDWNELINSVNNSQLENIFEEILIKVQAWNWLDHSMCLYATAFIFLSPFQLSMSWRPWIYLTGSKGTGKSTFFESIISGIYGPLVSRLDKSTPHATAQTIGNTGMIPIFDEFEKHKHIPDVLELAKLFNAGGRKTSGTPGEKANSYDLKHLAWFGSIYLPRQLGQDAAQESRMVKLEVKKLSNETPVLEKIDAAEGKKIAAKIISAMILNWDKIETGATKINKKRNEIIRNLLGIEIRTVENFMYASSLLNILKEDEDYSVPTWAVRQVEDDSEKIISAILSSMTRIDGEPHSISEVLRKTSSNCGEIFSKNLEQNGIKFTTKDGLKYLALRCETISRHLLKDTDFRDLDIQAPLSRIEGSVSSHPVKILGKQERCVLIPLCKIGVDCN